MPDFTLRYLRQKKVHFALYSVDLARVALQKNPEPRKPGDGHWTDFLDLTGVKPAHAWDKEFSGPLTCDFLQERITMDWAPPAGAYVLEATGVGSKARELILVTDMALVVKRSGQKALVYACGAIDGAPVAGARIRLLGSSEGDWHAEAVADQDGIARFDLPQSMAETNIVALASNGSRQAFAASRGSAVPSTFGAPIFYALTDRPAYRPGDKVQWKLTMRRQSEKDLSTPSGERIAYVITDPRQTKIKEGFLTLNAFGSAWDFLTLDTEPSLGEYRIAFHGVGKKAIEETESDESSGKEAPGQDALQEVILPDVLGEATLFRVEEYKLPEFKVTVRTSEGEEPRVFRPTEPIAAVIQANYYSGEAVSDADVEVAVYQKSYARIRRPFEAVAWMDEGQTRGDYAPPSSQPIRRETVKTDESGRAEFTFQPPDIQQDMEYTIQARVTDASRRMVPGEGQAIVSRRSSYADLSTGGMVFRLGEAMTVKNPRLGYLREPSIRKRNAGSQPYRGPRDLARSRRKESGRGTPQESQGLLPQVSSTPSKARSQRLELIGKVSRRDEGPVEGDRRRGIGRSFRHILPGKRRRLQPAVVRQSWELRRAGGGGFLPGGWHRRTAPPAHVKRISDHPFQVHGEAR